MPPTRRDALASLTATVSLALAGCGDSDDDPEENDPGQSDPSSLTDADPALTVAVTNTGEETVEVELRLAPVETSRGTRIARTATLSAGDRTTVDVSDPADSRLTVDDRTHGTSTTADISLDDVRDHGPDAVYAVSIDETGAMTTGFEDT
ncbi:MAG: hypothetical protein ACOCYZ_03775 [Halococcoides sp.]